MTFSFRLVADCMVKRLLALSCSCAGCHCDVSVSRMMQGMTALPVLPLVLPPAIPTLIPTNPTSTPQQQQQQAMAAMAAMPATVVSPFTSMMLPPSVLAPGDCLPA